MPAHITAETYLRKFEGSASNPAAVRCSDGEVYVIKGLNAGQMIFNDQVCALLGNLIGAAVPDVALVSLSQELIDINSSEIGHFTAGLCHATRYLPDFSFRENGVIHIDQGDNRLRFLRLAAFFGWMGGSDQQFIYENQPPRRVFSVDHGHFFHGGPSWTVDSLAQAPLAVVYPPLAQACHFKPEELAEAAILLQSVTVEQIVRAVARPPDAWGVPVEMRSALAKYIHSRREDLVASCLLQAT